MILAFFLWSLFFVPLINSQEQTSPAPTTTPPADDSSYYSKFWNYLFSPTAAPPAAEDKQNASPTAETSNAPAESSLTDSALDIVEDALMGGTTSPSPPPGAQADSEQNLLEQTLNYINQSPDAHADPNSIFGLFEALSQMIEMTPNGDMTIKAPTSEMFEKIKPFTDSFVDTSPLITLLKGYESYTKTKDTIGAIF